MTQLAVGLLILAGILVILHLTGCTQTEKHFHAQDITGANFGALQELEGFTDHSGRRFTSADYNGKAVVLFFGYTQCPDICPTNLTALQEALRRLGSEAERVQVVFVTVDPERDTEAVLANYVPWFDPRFIGLRNDPQTTRRAARAFRVYYAQVKGETALNYSVDHTAESYAYDPQGRLRLQIRHGETPAHISEDLSKLLAGQ
jgi:protein SCO1/2